MCPFWGSVMKTKYLKNKKSQMFSSGRSGMSGTSTRDASSEWLCRLRFWRGPPPRFKEIFKVLVEGLFPVHPHATMGTGLVKYTEGNPCIGTAIGEGSSDHSCGRTGLCIGGFCGKTSSRSMPG